MNNTDKETPHFITSHDFHGDVEYVAWLQEIKGRYQRIRSRIALQANYGTLEFNWLLGRDLVEKKAEQRWGTGVVEQLSLDMRAVYPDIKGFSSRNLWYMKQWYLFYHGDTQRLEKLHQLGAEITSPNRIISTSRPSIVCCVKTMTIPPLACSSASQKTKLRLNGLSTAFRTRWV